MNVMLTPEQQEALCRGEDISVTIDHTECVIIRKDVYRKVRYPYDDSEWTEGEMNAMANQMFDAADDADDAGPIE